MAADEDALDPRDSIIEGVYLVLSALVAEGCELTRAKDRYGDELAPKLIINRIGSSSPRLCWVAYESDCWPGGVSVSLEWLDPETGIEMSCITDQISPEPEIITRLSRLVVERGFSVVCYKVFGRVVHRYIRLDSESKKMLGINFNGEGIGGIWIWPFTVVESRIKFRDSPD